MAFLEVKNLYKNFGETHALDDVSFSIEEGEVLAVIGSSGGGKTTLLRCLCRTDMADGGEIVVDGEQVFLCSPETGKGSFLGKNPFGLVFQSFNLFPQYTVLDNLTLAPRLLAKAERNAEKSKKELYQEIEEKAYALLAMTGLTGKEKSYPCELSGGQCQRVAIARALMCEPKILCFDEPTSALDPALTGEVVKVIKDLKKKKRTLLVVTHDIPFARAIADRVIYMTEGRILECGNVEEVMDHPREEATRRFLDSVLMQ